MRDLFLNDHGWQPPPSFDQRFWAAHFCGRLDDVANRESDMLYRFPAWQVEAAFDCDEEPFLKGGTYNASEPTD